MGSRAKDRRGKVGEVFFSKGLFRLFFFGLLTQLCSSLSASNLLIYEGFQYGTAGHERSDSDLFDGQSDGGVSDIDATGLSGTWEDSTSVTTSDLFMRRGSLGFGDLAVSGNHVVSDSNGNNDLFYRTISANLSSGNALWFSIVAEKIQNNFSAAEGGFAMGNQALDDSRVLLDTGATGMMGFGIAPTTSGSDWTAYAWDGSSQIVGDADLNVSLNSRDIHLFVGKIVFDVGSGGNDQYTLYDYQLNNGNISGGTLSPICSTIEVDVDQTAIDTLSLTRQVNTAYDEIRIGDTLDAVIPTGNFQNDNYIAYDTDWNTVWEWSNSHEPRGTESANILEGVTVGGVNSVSSPGYSGNLILNFDAFLNMDNNNDALADHLPSDNSATIHFYDGSKIYTQDETVGSQDIYNPIKLHGAGTIEIHYNTHNQYYRGTISGPGSLHWKLRPWDTGQFIYLNPTTPSTYTGGTTVSISRVGEQLNVEGDRAFGVGDVRLYSTGTGSNEGPGKIVFSGSTTDVIADSAELWLYDSSKIDLGTNDETVRELLFEGNVQNPSGYPETWGSSSSGANQINDTYFSGSGCLIVLGGVDASPPYPNPMSFSVPPGGNSQTSIEMTATTATDINAVQYIFENVTTGSNSGYQSSAYWCEESLVAGNTYAYRVKARDSVGNETEWSRVYSTTPTIYNTWVVDGSNWNTDGSWSLGHVPTGSETAVISATNTVNSSASFATDYTGDLIIGEGSTFSINPDSHNLLDHLPSESTSEIHAYDNAYLYFRNQGGDDINNPIVLHGEVEVYTYWTGVDYLGQISGNGSIQFTVHNGASTLAASSPNTYTGGTTIYGNRSSSTDTFEANADGAFGAGNVTITGNLMHVNLGGTTTDVISNSADLRILGGGTLDLEGNNETVYRLYIDGVQMAAGTWGNTGSGAQFIDSTHFAGSGVLTVLVGPSPGTIFRVR